VGGVRPILVMRRDWAFIIAVVGSMILLIYVFFLAR
jgi:hypothetical protein